MKMKLELQIVTRERERGRVRERREARGERARGEFGNERVWESERGRERWQDDEEEER